MDNTKFNNLDSFKEYFLNYTLEQYKGKKFFALLLFYEDEDFNYQLLDTRFYTDGAVAFKEYANTPCPASQLIDAESIEELHNKILDMINNMDNEEWKKINLYPYL